jgi:acyl-CoA thioesterase I
MTRKLRWRNTFCKRFQYADEAKKPCRQTMTGAVCDAFVTQVVYSEGMILFLFGDSITYGNWDEHGGWADRVRADVSANDIATDFAYYHSAYNLGIDGNITAQVLERFDAETSARMWPHATYGIVFAIGTNDSGLQADGHPVSSPEQYQQELAALVQKAQALTDRIAFVNLCPVDETIVGPTCSTAGIARHFTNQRIEKFNATLQTFCTASQVTLIDVHARFADGSGLLADGLHPNGAGHALIADAVKQTIKPWLYEQ